MNKVGYFLFLSAFLLLSSFGLAGCNFLKIVPSATNSTATTTNTVTSPTEPGKNYHRIPPYVFLADFDLDPNLPVFRELTTLRDQITSELHLPPSDKPIKVHLFENKDKYEKFINAKYPNLPPRRAYFVSMPRAMGSEDLLVYSYWGNQIQQDLRHELTHALLHSVLLDVPLWLDEGLAEYFENPQGWSGINYKHLEKLQSKEKGTFIPNLDRLETLKKVPDMLPGEYRESWAWTHFMLRGNPKAKEVLLGYLHDLRTNAKPGPLRPRLQAAIPNLEQALHEHLDKLHKTKPGGV